MDSRPPQTPTVEAAPTLQRIGKESLPAAEDDPDPSEPTGSEIIYTEHVCPVCGEPVSDKQIYDRTSAGSMPTARERRSGVCSPKRGDRAIVFRGSEDAHRK